MTFAIVTTGKADAMSRLAMASVVLLVIAAVVTAKETPIGNDTAYEPSHYAAHAGGCQGLLPIVHDMVIPYPILPLKLV